MHLPFHGAAREVTGSCHLLEVGQTFLVHGEEGVMRKFANGLMAQHVDGDTIKMPKLGERVEL